MNVIYPPPPQSPQPPNGVLAETVSPSPALHSSKFLGQQRDGSYEALTLPTNRPMPTKAETLQNFSPRSPSSPLSTITNPLTYSAACGNAATD